MAAVCTLSLPSRTTTLTSLLRNSPLCPLLVCCHHRSPPPLTVTTIRPLSSSSSLLRIASGLVTGYENVAKNSPIEEVSEQPKNLDAAVDATVAAFEAVEVQVVKKLSEMSRVPFLDVQALLRSEDKE
ncbi:hypothetical protein L1987_20885 [Smallanthus sonchifolius]|uniref:Uncharacterized protein n=1 Tax=Smallanthus sonchifolius TaxID=185202 RepID=A0ACB9IVW6_9ASTR|nr:hypothetical protein L1987_20885 [Smallanthus sonchifolius]